MIYQAYQAYADMMDPLRGLAKAAVPFLSTPLSPPWAGAGGSGMFRNIAAAYDVFASAGLTHKRLPFGIDTVEVDGKTVPVTEEATSVTPFCTLLRFKKDTLVAQPRVLLVAPMSGHFATLLRGTVRTMLPDHDVYITDWHNARDVSMEQGTFDLDDFIEHLMRFLEVLGPGAHLVAVCQPTVAALAATALMAEDNNIAQPRSLTLMAGPLDCRVNPTEVNKLATGKPIEWFESKLIGTVPLRYPGALRRVYPGFLQISAFMSMNMDRHINSFRDMYTHLVDGDVEKAETIRTFYDEYFAMMDLPAEFYLQTIAKIFQEYELPRGVLQYRGRLVNPAAIRRTALFTVEGEKDDICSVGQTLAAQDLCTGLRPYMKQHHVQTGVGHYGVFNGRRWENGTYPMLREFIHVSE